MKKLSDKRKKKPKFLRQDLNKEKSLGVKWRKPKGLHSKLRLRRAGHGKKVSVGYGSDKKTRNIDPSGFKIKFVNKLADTSNVEKNEGIIIASNIGDKKRFEILKKAHEGNIKVLNIRDVEKKIKEITERFDKKKKESREREKERKKAKEESEKKKEKEKAENKEDEKKEQKEVTKKFVEEREHKKPQMSETSNIDKAPKQIRATAPKQK